MSAGENCPDWFDDTFAGATDASWENIGGYCFGSNNGGSAIVGSGTGQFSIEVSGETYESLDELEPCPNEVPTCAFVQSTQIVHGDCLTCHSDQCACSVSAGENCPDWFDDTFAGATDASWENIGGYCFGSNNGGSAIVGSGTGQFSIEVSGETYESLDELEPCPNKVPTCAKFSPLCGFKFIITLRSLGICFC